MKQLRVIGSQHMAQHYKAYGDAVLKQVRDAVAGSALLVQNDMRRSIQKGPKTGRTYRRGATRRNKAGKAAGYKFHRASAPGQAPASDSGRLVSHINFALRNKGLTAAVGVHDVSQVVYAPRMEFGGRDSRGIYIAPRPFARPALKRNRKAIVQRIGLATRQASRSISRGR